MKGFHVKQLDSIFSVTIFGCVKWSHSSCFNFFNFPKQSFVLTSFIYKMNFIASKPHHYVEALTLLSFPYHKKGPLNICMYINVYYSCEFSSHHFLNNLTRFLTKLTRVIANGKELPVSVVKGRYHSSVSWSMFHCQHVTV